MAVLYFPFSWILYFFYIASAERGKLLMDLRHFRKVHYRDDSFALGWWKVYKEFISFA